MVTLSSKRDASTALEDHSTSRSFFSRFALPIRSRSTRNLVDFHIRPAEPHRKYNAGDTVRGAVHLAVLKPTRVTHLTVALRGFVRVYKSPNAANEPAPFDSASEGVSQFRFLGNGYASLFRDEQVLTGEGKLDAGKYQFNFELMFPDDSLPSSIEFERGAISYTITATLTRPTALNATTSCERNVELIEQVDVGALPLPRPRTIYLEPISKKSKRKRASGSILSDRQTITSDNAGDTMSDLGSTRVIDISTDGSQTTDENAHDSQHNPRSPVHSESRSEVSGDSAASDITGPKSADLNQAGSTGTSGTIQSIGGTRTPGKKTITTKIELMKGGCLPGDFISVKVNVQHTKAIRSMHGVIVTLYRQGRVDSAPPVSLFKNLSVEERRKMEREEYYPKSKTGLGGLSLSSAGSCSVFRKDLSQAFSPLIMDPLDFTASVTTSVRVPEGAFPSIRGVPGEMISFKYRLEVIVDLGGKLSNAIQIGQNSRVAAGGAALSSTRDVPAGVTAFDGSLINTDALKREKGVIFDSFEVIVGTTDSARRGKAVARTNSYDSSPTPYAEDAGWSGGWEDEGYADDDLYASPNYPLYPTEPVQPQYPLWNGGSNDPRGPPPPQIHAPTYIPPPELPDERGLSEKERVRRAEQRLLPSRPDGPALAPVPAPGSSRMIDNDGAGPSTAPPPSSSPPPETEASAPTLEDLAASSSVPSATAADDKQELERQRLLAEASAPPEFPQDYDADAAAAGPSAPPPSLSPPVLHAGAEPSAPILSEEDEYGHRFAYGDAARTLRAANAPPPEPLPAYQR